MFNPENPINNISPERIKTAEESLRNFLKLKPEEDVLFLKDETTNSEAALILEQAVKTIGVSAREFILTADTKEEELKEKFKKGGVIIDMAAASEEKTENLYDDDLERLGMRLLNVFGLDPDALDNGGAFSEKFEDLEFRLNKMEEVLKKAEGFKITSVYGTDLELGVRPFGERRWVKDTGVIDVPGKWDNLPGGEIFTTPDEQSVNGVLVLPVLNSEIIKEQGVDELIKLTIHDGKIISIQGGRSAEILRKQLEEAAQVEAEKGRDPDVAYQIAEIAFGANAKARSAVSDPEQPYDFPAVSTLEAEKRFGTMHLAFGSSKHGEEGSEGFEDAICHNDFVIPRNGLTVEMFTSHSDYKSKKNSRKIINQGGLNFF